MTRALAFWFALLFALPVQPAQRIVDDAGRRLLLEHPPQRIVSLAPHLTELLFAVGAGERLVGVDSASDYPPAARDLPRIGDFSRVSLERVLAARPDLVVVWGGGNRAADIRQLQRLGLPVLVTEARRIEDVSRLLRLIGQAVGDAASGERAARAFDARLQVMRLARPRPPTPPGVFYQLWERPLMTVGGAHWISEALALCGTRNVFADLGDVAPVVSREAVLQRAPEIIAAGRDAPALRRSWLPYAALAAVRNAAFVEVDADLLHRPTPRLLDGVENLCEALAPYVR